MFIYYKPSKEEKMFFPGQKVFFTLDGRQFPLSDSNKTVTDMIETALAVLETESTEKKPFKFQSEVRLHGNKNEIEICVKSIPVLQGIS